MRRGTGLSGASLLLVILGVPAIGMADLVGGNDLINRTYVDGATGIIFFDLNARINSNAAITSWSIYAASQPTGTGQLKLKIFRDVGDTWQFIGESGLETVSTWSTTKTFNLATPISVQAGDIISWWYPTNTLPSIVYDEPTNTGWTINNSSWPRDVDFTSNIADPTLGAGDYGWARSTRVYSIQVHGEPTGVVPAPGAAFLAVLGLGSVGWFGRRRAARHD